MIVPRCDFVDNGIFPARSGRRVSQSEHNHNSVVAKIHLQYCMRPDGRVVKTLDFTGGSAGGGSDPIPCTGKVVLRIDRSHDSLVEIFLLRERWQGGRVRGNPKVGSGGGESGTVKGSQRPRSPPAQPRLAFRTVTSCAFLFSTIAPRSLYGFCRLVAGGARLAARDSSSLLLLRGYGTTLSSSTLVSVE